MLRDKKKKNCRWAQDTPGRTSCDWGDQAGWQFDPLPRDVNVIKQNTEAQIAPDG